MNSIVLAADAAVVAKLFKNEKQILIYIQEQLAMKYPDQSLTDQYFQKIIKDAEKVKEKPKVDDAGSNHFSSQEDQLSDRGFKNSLLVSETGSNGQMAATTRRFSNDSQ